MNENHIPAREYEIGYDSVAESEQWLNEIYHATRAASREPERELSDSEFYSTPSRVTPEQESEAHALLVDKLSKHCPTCGDPLDERGECVSCGYVDESDEPYSPYSDVDGYDRNGAFDGFQVVSDADPGL